MKNRRALFLNPPAYYVKARSDDERGDEMNGVACRDCGEMISRTAKGCWKCGRNLIAERLLAKYLLVVIVPALLLFVSVLVFLLIYRGR
jgi:RNA polymerase subunit RPABC4/transcription elongation factor Spt4